MTLTRWQLQEAKNRLSEVVRKAREEGPRAITLRGASSRLRATRFAIDRQKRFCHSAPHANRAQSTQGRGLWGILSATQSSMFRAARAP